MQTQNNSQLYNDYDEISLRELIEILIKQKAIIAGVTIVALLIAFVVSFFIMDSVYEANTVLMATQLNDYPKLELKEYIEPTNSPIILDEVIATLQLDGKDINRSQLKDMISTEIREDTNLIEIKVQNEDKVLATDIANTLSEKLASFITDIVREQYKIQLLSEEERLRAKIAQTEEELKKISPKIELKKSLSDDILLSQIKDLDSTDDIIITTEEKNDYYYQLEYLLSTLKINLSENLAKQENLNKKIENNENQIEIIKIITPAVEPLQPVSPRKMLNLAISGVLGLMIGVFVAFFREYWKNTSTDKKVASS